MERTWVMAAFLDLTGFRSWTYRAATAPEFKEQFISDFYSVLQWYVRTSLDSWAKYEGDGILVVKEFAPADRKTNKKAVEFILGIRSMIHRVQEIINSAESAPSGVRVRIVSGHVYKIKVLDPNDRRRERLITEYLDYCTNMVRGLLEVNPEIHCLATDGVVKSLGKKRAIFRVRPLGKPSCYPKGVNKEDVDGLQILKF